MKRTSDQRGSNRLRQPVTYTYTHVDQVDWSTVRPNRGGIIVYTVREDRVLLGFGVDNDSGDLTDFGGGIKQSDSTALQGSLREFHEESLGCFGHFTVADLAKAPLVYSEGMMIVFLQLELEPELVRTRFRSLVAQESQPEVRDIHWVDLEQLRTMVNQPLFRNRFRRSTDPRSLATPYPRIYSRVRKHLSNFERIVELLGHEI